MKSATDILRDEHVLILRGLDTVERAAERLEAGAGVADAWWQEAVAWLRGFADRTHHAKEENLLFPAMARAGVPQEGGPIGVMLAEHVEGRRLIAMIAEGQGARRAQAARRYVALLRAHIDKENNVLFMIADGVLDDAARQRLQGEFEQVTADLGAEGAIGHAERALEALAAAVA
jgi:hemerythrin-like domain-containing protein